MPKVRVAAVGTGPEGDRKTGGGWGRRRDVDTAGRRSGSGDHTFFTFFYIKKHNGRTHWAVLSVSGSTRTFLRQTAETVKKFDFVQIFETNVFNVFRRCDILLFIRFTDCTKYNLKITNYIVNPKMYRVSTNI